MFSKASLSLSGPLHLRRLLAVSMETNSRHLSLVRAVADLLLLSNQRVGFPCVVSLGYFVLDARLSFFLSLFHLLPKFGDGTCADYSFQPDPALIQPYDPSFAPNTPAQALAYNGNFHEFQPPPQMFQPPSPAPSDASSHGSYMNGPIRARSVNGSPYLYHPYPAALPGRRPSIGSMHSLYSHDSPRSSVGPDGEASERGRCPNPDCGRLFKDLKAHMLTHQSERPEKCPIVTCEYHQKGFARKYDKNRHTLTHYKGTMVCGFCPGPGSAAEKSFNRADVFKRHLTSVHGVEQNPPNSRKKSPSLSSTRKSTSASQDAAGKCSSCSITFSNAQDLFDHLDQCILNQLSRSDPSEAINERCLAGIANDRAVQETMERNLLPLGLIDPIKNEATDEDEEDDDEVADMDEQNVFPWTGTNILDSRSGKGTINPGKRDPS